MPGDEGGILGFLDEEIGGPAEKIAPIQILHRVNNLLLPDEIVQAPEEQMRLMPIRTLERAAVAAFEILQTLAQRECMCGRYHPNRRDVSRFLKVPDLLGCQLLRQEAPSSGTSQTLKQKIARRSRLNAKCQLRMRKSPDMIRPVDPLFSNSKVQALASCLRMEPAWLIRTSAACGPNGELKTSMETGGL